MFAGAPGQGGGGSVVDGSTLSGGCGLAKHSINKLCCHEIYKSASGANCRGCHKVWGHGAGRVVASAGSQWVADGWQGGAACLVPVTRQLQNKRTGHDPRAASERPKRRTDGCGFVAFCAVAAAASVSATATASASVDRSCC